MKKLHMSIQKSTFLVWYRSVHNVCCFQSCVNVKRIHIHWTEIMWSCGTVWMHYIDVTSYKKLVDGEPKSRSSCIIQPLGKVCFSSQKAHGQFPSTSFKSPVVAIFQCWTTTIHNFWELNLNKVLKATVHMYSLRHHDASHYLIVYFNVYSSKFIDLRFLHQTNASITIWQWFTNLFHKALS